MLEFLEVGVFILTVKGPATSSSLIEAESMGDMEKMQTLLEQGTDLNAKDDDGYTALMMAPTYGHIDIVKILLEKGADVNAGQQNTPFPLQGYRGHS